MWRILLPILLANLLFGCANNEIPATKLEKANVLPLALDDDFEFRKQKLSFYEPGLIQPTESEAINFERKRLEHGAVDSIQRRQRAGNYFSFFWRAKKQADITVRLEYRQTGLGNYVLAQERYYPAAKGSYQTDFQITGDDYLEFGRVTSWRALLISDGKIVALTQSFIWR